MEGDLDITIMDDKRISSLEKRVERLEEIISTTNVKHELSNKNSLEETIIENIDSISMQQLVLLSLSIHKEQTKKEIQATIENWGKPLHGWFVGGNFCNRLVKTAIVKLTTNEKNEKLYSLTGRGKIKTNKIIEKLTSENKN